MGIPLSVARGVRLPTDPWTPRDWALAQAASQLDRMKCPRCHTPLWLAYDPALENHWRADLPVRCHPCTAISRKQEQYKDSDHAGDLRFTAKRV